MLNGYTGLWCLAALLIVAAGRGEARKATVDVGTRRVWSGPGVDVEGAPSPDGRYLSFVDWDTGDLALRDLVTGKSRRLTNKGTWYDSHEWALESIISPDGKQVAYAWMNSEGAYDLRLIGLDRSSPRVLYHDAGLRYIQPADWSWDGNQILALLNRPAREEGSNQIVLVSVADGSLRVLKNLAHGIPSRMSLSPDGRFIAYDSPSREGASERDIFLLATDGSREIPLVQHPADDAVIGWAPDGASLLFTSDRTGTKGIWRLEIGDGQPRGAAELVKREMGAWSPLGLTRNGTLFYATQSGMMDVYTAPLDPATGEVLAPPQPANPRLGGSNSSPAWSPDGRYLAYLSPERHALRINEQRSRVISIRAVESGEAREFPLKLLAIGQPYWSPDGRFLLAAGWDEDVRTGAFRIDAQTGSAAAVADTENFIWRAVWAPDGKAVFYARAAAGAQNSHVLRMREIVTGREEELYRGGIIRTLAISPDSRQVALTEEEERSRLQTLKVIPAAGGEPRELLRVEPPAAMTSLAWMPDGRHLLFVRENAVWRIPVAGGKPQRLGLAMNKLRGLSVHPGGRQIAFTAGSAEVEVWVLENFLPAQITKPRAPRR